MGTSGSNKVAVAGKQQFWLEHWQQCLATPGTVKRYADIHGLNLAVMYWWHRALIDRGLLAGKPKRISFKKVVVLPDNHQPVPFRVIFPNGVVMEWMDERMERTKELLGLVASLS
ncbi:MAG: hypothetical protein HQM05_04775 [Magnetococcales bacterium]|nr:hypothetical protein [Magnetococcales bacterium]